MDLSPPRESADFATRRKEAWHIGPEHGDSEPNLWPKEMAAEFKPLMTGLYASLESVALEIFDACSEYIGRERRYFRERVEIGNTA